MKKKINNLKSEEIFNRIANIEQSILDFQSELREWEIANKNIPDYENIKKSKHEEYVDKVTKLNTEMLTLYKEYEDTSFRDESGALKPGALQLGATYLIVPPSRISVFERTENTSVDLLRAPGSLKTNTGRQDLEIQLEIIFPDLDSINNNFRPLLAQLYRAPFLSIENVHINKLINPQMYWKLNTNVRKEKTPKASILSNMAYTYYERVISKGSVNEDSGASINLSEKDKKRMNEEKQIIMRKMEEEVDKLGNEKNTAQRLLNEADKNDTELYKKLEDTLKKKQQLYQQAMDKAIEFNSLVFEDEFINKNKVNINIDSTHKDQQIGVAVQSVTVNTIPGLPQALQCNISLKVFNYTPYSYDFSFLQTIEDAVKQIEYYSARNYLRYPKEFRELRDIVFYEMPTIGSTKDASQSEPFMFYIKPMLTGSLEEIEVTVDMIEEHTGKISKLTRGFGFLPTKNYLRKITEQDLKAIDIEFEITKLTLEDRDYYANLQTELITRYTEQLRVMANCVKTDTSFLEMLEYFVKSTYLTLLKTVTLYAAQQSAMALKNSLIEPEEQTFTPNNDIAIKDKNGKLQIIVQHGTQINMSELRKQFLKFIPDFASFENEMQNQLRLQFISEYGYQTKYKFNFQEDGDTIITGLSAGFSHKLAPIPLQAYHLPTYQHMGKNDWAIEMSIQTCNIEFLSIMRDINNKIRDNRICKNRSENEWWISKLNAIYLNPDKTANGFFKLLGILNVLPDGMNIASIPDKPGWFNVTISLLQDDIDPVNYEKLRWINSYDNEVINKMLLAMMKEYKWVNDSGFKDTLSMFPYFTKQIIPKFRSYGFQQFFNVFYGADRATYPDINDGMIESSALTDNLKDTNIEIIPIPNGTITSGYTENRVSPTHPETKANHNGVDIVSDDKTLRAPAEGTVKILYTWKNTKDGPDEKAGTHIKLAHEVYYGGKNRTLYTNYFHLANIAEGLKIGQKVNKGDVLGTIGSTGDSTGDHLHFEIYYMDGGEKQFIDPQKQNAFTDNISNISDDFVSSKSNNNYLVTDKQITDLYNKEWKFKDFVLNCSSIVEKLYYENLYTGWEIESGDTQEFNINNPYVKRYSTEVQDFYKKFMSLKAEGASNPSGKVIVTPGFERRIIDVCDILDQKYVNFSLFSVVNDINKLKVNDVLKHQFFRSLVLQYISTAPFEFATLYNKYYPDANLNISSILPQWNDKTTINGEAYDLYSNYLDLELPTYQNSINSTPTDFYFKRFEDIVPFNYIEEKIQRYSKSMQNSWKDQMLDGFYAYERIMGDGELKSEADSLLNQMISDPIGFAQAKYATQTESFIEKLATKTNIGIKSGDYKKFIKEEFQQIKANTLSYDLRKLSLLRNILQLSSVWGDFKNNVRNLNEKGINVEKVSTSDPQSNFISDIQNKFIMGISDINTTLSVPTDHLLGIVTPFSLYETQDIINRTKMDYDNFKGRDKTKNMEKAFPTIKLFFVEEDSHSWQKLDDYYVYNSIESCKIIKSANSASDLCEIIVSNITGNLTNEYSLSQKENVNYDQTTLEQDINKIFVSEGSTIMIKSGYDNNIEFLDRCFFGKVVSIQYGDRIKITAQSFGAELHEYVNNGDSAKYGFFSACRTHGDVVLSALESLDNMLNFGSKSVYEMLGYTNIYEEFDDMKSKYNEWYDLFTKARSIDIIRKFIPVIDMYTKFGIFDPRYENIYLPVSKITTTPLMRTLLSENMRNAWSNLFDIFGIKGKAYAEESVYKIFKQKPVDNLKKYLPKIGKELESYQEKAQIRKNAINAVFQPITNIATYIIDNGGAGVKAFSSTSGAVDLTNYISDLGIKGTFDWTIEEGTTFWNLLNEIKLYHLDYIVTVLPYNDFIAGKTRETLYVGPRNGFYKFTDIFDSSESIKKFNESIKNKREIQKMIYDKGRKENFSTSMEQAYEALEKVKSEIRTKYNISSDQNIEYDKLSSESKILLNDAIKNYSKYLSLWKQVTGTVPQNVKDIRPMLSDFLSQMKKDSLIQTEAERDKTATGSDSDIIEYNINNPDDLIYYNERGEIESSYASYIPVVNYYYADSFSNIISNNIQASSEEIYNRLLLKYPADPNTSTNADLVSEEFLVDDNIVPSSIKTHISRQNNIDPNSCFLVPDSIMLWAQTKKSIVDKTLVSDLPYQKIVGYNIMADDMRKMYRGNLTLVGMPYVKPYDVILLNDQYLNMTGPIEVETVVHEFSKDGFTTTITPKAIISLNNPAKAQEMYLRQGFQLPWLGAFGQVGGNGNPLLNIISKAGTTLASFAPLKQTRLVAPSNAKEYRAYFEPKTATEIKEFGNIPYIGSPYLMYSKPAKEIVKGTNYYYNNMIGIIAGKSSVFNYIKDESSPNETIMDYIDQGLTYAQYIGAGFALMNATGLISVTAPAWVSTAGVISILSAAVVKGLHIGLYSWGFNKYINRDFINIVGLWYRNTPMVAGVEGMYKDDITVHMKDTIYSLVDVTADINVIAPK